MSKRIDSMDINDNEKLMAAFGETINNTTMNTRNKKYASGGRVPIEAEGGEVMQYPNGQLMDIIGSSHEQGGVDINAPEGSTVYSKRIKIDGKSMADRKRTRDNREKRLDNLRKSRGYDAFLLNAINRTQETNAKQEQKDNFVQELIGSIMPQPQQKAAYGWGDAAFNMFGLVSPEQGGKILDALVPDVPRQDTKAAFTQPMSAQEALGGNGKILNFGVWKFLSNFGFWNLEVFIRFWFLEVRGF